ncbi:hypothetical protein B296_00013474 [Ensete ventricosum]|uniref:Uncharacterized protein n=1 Tax=Ensete ventricosum TaxID=4639 RepID=A0A426ZPA2_ENSVE|nr:hypothetical protein B296_00013474 [Ensete ventricosum]
MSLQDFIIGGSAPDPSRWDYGKLKSVTQPIPKGSWLQPRKDPIGSLTWSETEPTNWPLEKESRCLGHGTYPT